MKSKLYVVEVSENYCCVTVVTSMNDAMKSRKVFNDVIKSILKLSEMHSFKCEEYLIAPSDVAKARNLPVNKRTLYNIKHDARLAVSTIYCHIGNDTCNNK